MNYVIIKKFGPGSPGWKEYVSWSGLQGCQDFYSIDNTLRENLFTPESAEDWNHCIREDFKTHIIVDPSYAQRTCAQFPDAEAVGIIENPRSFNDAVSHDHELLGYDIIDGFNSISLLTNWGGKETIIELEIQLNTHALLGHIDQAYQLKDRLRREFSNEPHAKGCEVWAVYKLL